MTTPAMRDSASKTPPVMATAGFRIPLKHAVRGIEAAEGILVHGSCGWGEYSPVPGYSSGRQRDCWRAAVSSATEAWPQPVRDRVPVVVMVPAVPAQRAVEIVQASGCRDAKVKVGEGDDEERLEAVREALGPRGRIRIDANAAWSLDEAARAIKRLSRYDLELAEQPVGTVEEMVKLRGLIDIPLAADELVRGAAEARSLALRGAADILVLKVQHLGGVAESLRVAEAAGLPVIVSSLLETSIGIAAGLALAAAMPELPYACGLGTSMLLESDLTTDPLVARDGHMPLRRPEPDAVLLERFAAEVAGPDGTE